MFKSLRFLVVLMVIPSPAQSRSATPTVMVEVMTAHTSQSRRQFYIPGLGQTTSTNCTSTPDGGMTNCTSSTRGSAEGTTIPTTVQQVDILVRMPDGTVVEAMCSTWSSRNCINPQPGQWPARIGKHDIMLKYKTEGQPEYNSDGTLKKARKLKENWAKFNFEKK